MRAPSARVGVRPILPLQNSKLGVASFQIHAAIFGPTSPTSGLSCKSTGGMTIPSQELRPHVNTSLDPKQNCSRSDIKHQKRVRSPCSGLAHRHLHRGSLRARPSDAKADAAATSSASTSFDGRIEIIKRRGIFSCAPATAAALLLLAPGPLLAPAVARIPTEVVLSDGGGSVTAAAAGSGRSALLQLAAHPSAVLAPAERLDAESGPSGMTRGSNYVAGRVGVAPGTMVGTPNYARGPAAAGPGLRSTANAAADALQLLTSAREAVDRGQHDQALELYGRLVSDHPDLALAEYGRIGRAMMLYQVGRTSDSILALEDEEVVMRGAAEVHAALAALLYAERPNLALWAEEEWNLACLFDTRYSDLVWVQTNKHWPPRMIAALQKFLTLS
ncbi:hypothetical protein Vretimale_19849 [Volvox reticuliferus]|uniref:Tetratricopeptide repeat protein n=1 Tax=Volvox reticuliferus TaxID=1737510 RepID=A0A8J4FVR7_9CHLO|nr:hypothetical protein Vretifemale_19893 [Volvox reticuliferus]GIM17314.1 hypothetical protein Vretimale_19849 [Volvox reticuliferus]